MMLNNVTGQWKACHDDFVKPEHKNKLFTHSIYVSKRSHAIRIQYPTTKNNCYVQFLFLL